MESTELIQKAIRAVASARLLLADGDIEGACNRAYYAMHDAALAVLLPVLSSENNFPKSHSGLISLFSQHFVKTKKLPVEFGKLLNRAAEIRLVADYSGGDVSIEDAAYITQEAENFINAVQTPLL